MQIIAVVNQKGGVGKTTSVANLGAALARRGHKVLLVDLDPQGHLSISFDALPEPGEPSIYSLIQGDHEFAQVARETSTPGLYIAPSNLDLAGAESELASEIGRETILRHALERYEATPDAAEIVLFDCPPSLGVMSLNALVSASWVIVPVQAEFFALQGMAQLLDVLERVRRRLNPRLEILGMLVGLYSKSRNLSREVIAELKEHFGELLFPTLVRMNVRLAEAPSHGATIFEYAPSSTGAADFTTLAEECEHRLGLGVTLRNGNGRSTEAEPAAPPAPAVEPRVSQADIEIAQENA